MGVFRNYLRSTKIPIMYALSSKFRELWKIGEAADLELTDEIRSLPLRAGSHRPGPILSEHDLARVGGCAVSRYNSYNAIASYLKWVN